MFSRTGLAAPPGNQGSLMPISGRHALVIGGSMAGLCAARALSERFDRVTLVERDVFGGPDPRKGVPQGRHLHALLRRGLDELEGWFPGLNEIGRAHV